MTDETTPQDGKAMSPASAGSQRDTFEAAVMNWISEATSLIQWRSDGGRMIMTDACERCWNTAKHDGERIQGITLTDAEREAIEGAMWGYGQYADEMALSVAEVKEKQAALRSLLERLS